jgi:hypothetical protein
VATFALAVVAAPVLNKIVLEAGTHDQLVAARGRYAELFELQAAGYR